MIFSFGDNSNGELGLGNQIKTTTTPTTINSLIDYRINDIECGEKHIIALGVLRKQANIGSTSKNTFLFGWGDNSYNQCSNANDKCVYLPTILKTDNNMVSISCGKNHTLIMNENGDAFSFGDNSFGQIGGVSNQKVSPFYKVSNSFLNQSKEKIIIIKASANSNLIITNNNNILIYGNILNSKTSYKVAKLNNINDLNSIKVHFSDLRCAVFSYSNSYKKDNLHEVLYSYDEIKEIKQTQVDNKKTLSEKRYGSEKEVIPIITSQEEESDKNKKRRQNNLSMIDIKASKDSQTKMNKSNSTINITSKPKTRNQNEIVANSLPNHSIISSDISISKAAPSTRTVIQDQSKISINKALEQSMEELRSYIDLVSPIETGTLSASTLSFRPKNLPKKTPEEEEYHRRLVEENKKLYLNNLKEKQLKEQRIKQRMEYKKKKMNDLAKIWSESLLPKWTDIKDKKTIKHYFYEGLPDNLRGKIWMLCLGNSFSITLDYYNIEVKKAIEIFLKNSSKDTKLNQSTDIETSENKYNIIAVGKEKSIYVIDLDIERTFPYLGIFKSNSPLSEDLREILRAFVASRPDIGYVQGLSFIGGMLLLNMDKFKAYVAMMNLVLNPIILPFYIFDEKAIRARIQLFKQVFYYNLPELCDHFESLEILPEHYFIEWNMTLFTKSVNIDIAMRIWDIYMIEGITAIYSAAIVFLSHFEDKFMEMNFDDILKQIKTINLINFDDDLVVEAMKNVKYPEWVLIEIEKLTEEGIPL